MAFTGNLEWLYELAAWSATGGGLLLATWAIWWDRSRGRRRCPKCWYDMSATVGLTCPECGTDAGTERRLFRTRRRLSCIAVALTLVLVGPAGIVATGLLKGNWRSNMPTLVLVALAEAKGWPEPPVWPGKSVTEELMHRRPGMGTWWLKRVSNRMARWSFTYRPVWPKGVPLAVQPGKTFWYGEQTRATRLSLQTDGMQEWSTLEFGGSRVNCQAAWWDDQYATLDPLQRGDKHFAVQLRTDPQNGWGCAVVPGTPPAWAGSLKFPIRVVDSIDEAIGPVQSQQVEQELRSSLSIVNQGKCGLGIGVALSGTARLQGIAVAIRVEVRHRDQVVAVARGWDTGDGFGDLSGPASRVFDGDLRLESDGTSRTIYEAIFASADDSWQVVVSGDGALALRDFAATAYWAGTFSIPLDQVRRSQFPPSWGK
jgi:hypothetical protein